MNSMPGFNADVSLYKANEHYQIVVMSGVNDIRGQAVIPQLWEAIKCWLSGGGAECWILL